MKALTKIKGISGVGLACGIFSDRADRLGLAAESAYRREEAVLVREKELRETVLSLQEGIEQRDHKISTISKALHDEQENHKSTRTHMQDDFEYLRSRLLRGLKQEVSLLDEGLHAIKREPPKVMVMEDHAERVLEGLKREIGKLRLEKDQ